MEARSWRGGSGGWTRLSFTTLLSIPFSPDTRSARPRLEARYGLGLSAQADSLDHASQVTPSRHAFIAPYPRGCAPVEAVPEGLRIDWLLSRQLDFAHLENAPVGAPQ